MQTEELQKNYNKTTFLNLQTAKFKINSSLQKPYINYKVNNTQAEELQK